MADAIWFTCYSSCHCCYIAAGHGQTPERCPEHGHGWIGIPERITPDKPVAYGIVPDGETQEVLL